MDNQDPDYFILQNRCPQCGEHLEAHTGFKVNGVKVTQAWFVACDSVSCDYVYPHQFATLENLAKTFEAED